MQRFNNLDITNKLNVDGCIVLNGKRYTSFEPASEEGSSSSSSSASASTAEKLGELKMRVDDMDTSLRADAFEPRVRAVVNTYMKTVPGVTSYVVDQAVTRDSITKLTTRVDHMDALLVMQRSTTSTLQDDIAKSHDHAASTFEPRVRAIAKDMIDAALLLLLAPPQPPPPPPPPVVAPVSDPQILKDMGVMNERISAMIRNSAAAAKEIANTRQLADRAQLEAKALRDVVNVQERRIAELEDLVNKKV